VERVIRVSLVVSKSTTDFLTADRVGANSGTAAFRPLLGYPSEETGLPVSGPPTSSSPVVERRYMAMGSSSSARSAPSLLLGLRNEKAVIMAQVHSNLHSGLPAGSSGTPYVTTVRETAHSVSAQTGCTSDDGWSTARSAGSAVLRHLDGGPVEEESEQQEQAELPPLYGDVPTHRCEA
jgi:hypothetical protein